MHGLAWWWCVGFEICELDRGHIVGAHSIQHTLHIVRVDTQHRGRPTAFKHRTHQLFVNICRAQKHTQGTSMRRTDDSHPPHHLPHHPHPLPPADDD